jgi:hypothetical protein
MTTTKEREPATSPLHLADDELPPAGSATVRYHYASFGGMQVLVSGDLLEELERP